MSTSTSVNSAVVRAPKMAHLSHSETPRKYLGDLPLPFKEKIAGYLPFQEAFTFVGKKLSFATWLIRREGIDDTDGWSSHKKMQDMWDRRVFPRMLGKIEKEAASPWFKSLTLAQVTHGQLRKFSSFTFSHLKSSP